LKIEFDSLLIPKMLRLGVLSVAKATSTCSSLGTRSSSRLLAARYFSSKPLGENPDENPDEKQAISNSDDKDGGTDALRLFFEKRRAALQKEKQEERGAKNNQWNKKNRSKSRQNKEKDKPNVESFLRQSDVSDAKPSGESSDALQSFFEKRRAALQKERKGRDISPKVDNRRHNDSNDNKNKWVTKGKQQQGGNNGTAVRNNGNSGKQQQGGNNGTAIRNNGNSGKQQQGGNNGTAIRNNGNSGKQQQGGNNGTAIRNNGNSGKQQQGGNNGTAIRNNGNSGNQQRGNNRNNQTQNQRFPDRRQAESQGSDSSRLADLMKQLRRDAPMKTTTTTADDQPFWRRGTQQQGNRDEEARWSRASFLNKNKRNDNMSMPRQNRGAGNGQGQRYKNQRKDTDFLQGRRNRVENDNIQQGSVASEETSIVTIPSSPLTLTEVSTLFRVKVDNIKRKLRSMRERVPDDSEAVMDVDMMELLAMEFGIETERSTYKEAVETEDILISQRRVGDEAAALPPRPPVVCIMVSDLTPFPVLFDILSF
jgi:hypothetical protein